MQPTNVSTAGHAGMELGTRTVVTPPPSEATAAENAAYWASLDEAEQTHLATTSPELIGHRNGIAGEDRDTANRILLDRKRVQIKDRLADLRAGSAADPTSGGESTRTDNQQEIGRLEQRLGALSSLERMTKAGSGEALPERQLLAFHANGDQVQAAVATGNVDTADHVAVFTPGMNADIGENIENYVADMRDLKVFAENQLSNYGSGGSVATVTWLGYLPPCFDMLGTLSDIFTGDAAGAGAKDLADFYNGINEWRVDDPHMTALGHSYGSLTTGIALTEAGTGVDDAVFFGSPGISATPAPFVDGIAALHLDEGSVYNLEAEGDFVADIPDIAGWYGSDVADLDRVHQLSTGKATAPDGTALIASHGHCEYTKITSEGTPSTSLYNIANVVAGMPERTIGVP